MLAVNRREMLRTASCGFGYLALAGLCGKQAAAAAPSLAAKTPSLPAKATRCTPPASGYMSALRRE